MKDNLTHVYTGEGKGKTTAAVGLALRAAGRGYKTLIIQFMKGQEDGIQKSLEKFSAITVESYGRSQFLQRGEATEQDKKLAQKGLKRFKRSLKDKEIDMIVLDELCVALDYDLIDSDSLLDLIASSDKELVITGRKAPKELIEAADYVSHIKNIKHPYQQGQQARKGIEY